MLRAFMLSTTVLLLSWWGEPFGHALTVYGGEIPVSIAAFPVQGPTEGLEAEILDFRYRPGRWQTCIGLVDDPHKTIVGDDGGLYYDYGKQGPEAYDNGQGVFATRVLARFESGSDQPGPVQQSLLGPRVPLVISRQAVGDWNVVQEAWSAVVPGAAWNRTGEGRVDYLSLAARNDGANPATGQVKLQVGSLHRLKLDATRTRLLIDGQEDQVFCQFSQPCSEPEGEAVSEESASYHVRTDTAIRVQREWAHPADSCAACFHDVLIGFGQPLDFQISVSAGEKVNLVFGLIEGWHSQPAQRPLRIEIEGRTERIADLVREVGKDAPLVIPFSAVDEDQDGVLRVRIAAASGAVDGNTILSGLWVFPGDKRPDLAGIKSGHLTDTPLAIIDANHVPNSPRPMELTWDIQAVPSGGLFDLLVALPAIGTDSSRVDLSDTAALRQQGIDAWQQADLPYDRWTVPDPAIQGLLDSCIRNIYQAREWKDGRPKFQVGPTCYRGTWAADGPFLLEAVSYLGRTAEARAGLEQQVDGDDGPSGVEFSKKSGLRLWMIWRHAQLTGDRAWLQHMWPKVEREVKQIVAYRDMTRSDPQQMNAGLMPIGFGDGGLGGKHREYTNVYWTLAGLKAAIEMAKVMNAPSLGDWQREYADYWTTFDRARERDKQVDEAGNCYVPVTMKGEKAQLPQCGAWAFLQSIFPGRIFAADDPLMLGTMSLLDANQREGLIYGTGWIPDGIWNYAASFYGHAHLWLGHGPKAAATLYAMGNHASPLLCWREEQNVIGDPLHFVGDMPHNWGSAEFIRLVRHLVILERDQSIHVLPGLPRAWTRPGHVLAMHDVPTALGTISVRVEMSADAKTAQITVDPPDREPLSNLVIHLEGFGRPVESVSLDGAALTSSTASLKSGKLAGFQVTFGDSSPH